MWGRGYWGATYWAEEYWPTGTAGAVVPVVPPPASGTGGPKPRRRKFVLDLPHKEREEPKRKERARRSPEVHAALSLTAPLPVLSVAAAVAELLPVMARLTLPQVATPSASVQVQVTSLLGLAHERVEELEAALAAVLED